MDCPLAINRYHIKLNHCYYTGDQWHSIWDDFTKTELFNNDNGAVQLDDLKKIRGSLNEDFIIYTNTVLEYVNEQLPETIFKNNQG